MPWSHNCVYTTDCRVLQRFRLGHIQNICMMMNTLIWRPSKFAHSGGGKKKKNLKNKQTSIWRLSSQTAGCIKGPACLFHMDPVTFTHPRAGRARTNSVTASEHCVQRREKSLVCLPEEVTWPALFHTRYVKKRKKKSLCFCCETNTHTALCGLGQDWLSQSSVRRGRGEDELRSWRFLFWPGIFKHSTFFFYFQRCNNKVSLSVSHDSGL